jgi:hypothetical protein
MANEAGTARVVSAAEMARLFDCTVRQLELLVKKGIAVRLGLLRTYTAQLEALAKLRRGGE